MARPLLQVALDNKCLEDAIDTLGNGLGETVDIIECGTYLIMMEGVRAIRLIRRMYPHKMMVADFKLILPQFGSAILAEGAELNTINSTCMDITVQKIHDEATSRGQKVEIEFYGNAWSFEKLEQWKAMGIEHVIYTRPRVLGGDWGEKDVEVVKKICDMGFKVTVAGGISYKTLDVLAGLPIFALICGRSLYNADDPAAEAKRMIDRIKEIWGE